MLRRLCSQSAFQRLTSFVACHQHRSAASTASADPIKSAFSYCTQQVREQDVESFYWISQLPASVRAAVLALHAFSLELDTITLHMREASLAQIRFEWWRGAIDGLYTGKVLQHPVLTALSLVVEGRPGMQRHFHHMLDSGLESLWEQPASLGDMGRLAEGSGSQLIYLTLHSAGQHREAAALEAASHVGKASVIVKALRRAPKHPGRLSSVLPADLCLSEGLEVEDIRAGQKLDKLANVVLEVASTAQAHLEAARQLQLQVPMGARPLLLPATACSLYLQALQKSDFDVFAPQLRGGGYSLPWYLLRLKACQLRGTY